MHNFEFAINTNNITRCEAHPYLNVDDIHYIKELILHTRFEEGTHSGGVSLKYSGLFEAGKTIMQAVEYLQDIFSYVDASLKLDPKALTADGSFKIGKIKTNDKRTSRHTLFLKMKYGHINDDQIGYSVIIECGSHRKEVFRTSYVLNEAEIMSYDMNFPAPILFISEVYTGLKNSDVFS